MKFLGRMTATIALLFLSRAWQGLKVDLEAIYAEYCNTVRSKVPAIVIKALILAEDRRFSKHGGIDPIAIGRAVWNFIVHRKLEGGSTIEQQLIRKVTGQYKRQFYRKMREILIASLVERVIPKYDIPGVYLSIAYFGWRMNGFQQACHRLGIDLSNITPPHAASIVARLKYPQPKVVSDIRARQIAVREKHILNLLSREN